MERSKTKVFKSKIYNKLTHFCIRNKNGPIEVIISLKCIFFKVGFNISLVVITYIVIII